MNRSIKNIKFQTNKLFDASKTQRKAELDQVAQLRPLSETMSDFRFNFIHRRLSRNFALITSAIGTSVETPRILNNHPLSSASSLMAYIKNYYQRGHIRLPKDFLSSVCELVNESNNLYQSRRFQRPIIEVYEEQRRNLESKLKLMQPLARYNPKIQGKVIDIEHQLQGLKFTLSSIEKNVVEKNLYPQMTVSGLNDNIKAKTIKGIYIRVAGPVPGTKAEERRKMFGKYSNRSSEDNAEISKGFICSTLGVYGITIRIAYGTTALMVPKNVQLNEDYDKKPFVIENKPLVAYYTE